MKKTFLKGFTFLFCATLFLASCTSDDGDSNSVGDEGVSTGEYLPLALNNEWNLESSYGATTNIKFTETESFQGETYYMFSQIEPTYGVESSQGFRKSGATYYIYTPEVSLDLSGYSLVNEAFTTPFFRDDLAEGESISSNVTYNTVTTISGYGSTTVSTTATYTSTIEAKDVSVTVNDVTYDNVIKVHLNLYAVTAGSSQPTEADTYFYFAKDIGFIRTETQGMVSDLVSYQLY